MFLRFTLTLKLILNLKEATFSNNNLHTIILIHVGPLEE